MYRKRFSAITPRNVSEFLLLDRDFPRAIQYCILKAEGSLRAIMDSPAGRFTNAAERQLGRLQSDLGYASITEIIANGLHEYLDGLQTELNSVDSAIHETFFGLDIAPARAMQYQSQ
jgi:uncharacterized alpha-E superfamily protein